MSENGPLGFQPLADTRVVDLTTTIAGLYCSRLLSDIGATVLRVEPEDGHPLRHWSAVLADPVVGDGALFTHLTAGQETADASLLSRKLAKAQACLWTPGSLLDPAAIQEAHPHLVVVAITPFGLDTPWSDRPATEFTLQAWSGAMIGLGRGDPELPPVYVGGQVGEYLAGTYAATGLLAALRQVQQNGGAGCLVDLSLLEVHALCLTFYPVTFHDIVGGPMRKRRALTVPGVAVANDGLVGLGVGTGQQWLDFCVMAGHPEWAEDASLFSERGALAEKIDDWVGNQSVEEILGIASAFRIPNAPIVNGENAGSIKHFAERKTFKIDANGVIGPRSPLRITGGSRPVEGDVLDSGVEVSGGIIEAGALPLSGVRVLDMTAYWAGPSASQLLGLMGAEVIHLESAKHPDGSRLVGATSKKLDDSLERGPIFAALNTNKRSLCLDFGKPEGLEVLKHFISTCDVVIENFTPRVFDSLGLNYETLKEIREDLIVVRMPGFGLDGPLRDHPAFAFVIEDASGLTWMTGHPDRPPVEPYCIGDSNAGLHAAYGVLAALKNREVTGEGCQVESAMVDSALSIAADQVLEHSAYGVMPERSGNRGPTAAPQNLYECAGVDEYGREPNRVAIAVENDAQWEFLCGALGNPEWTLSGTFKSNQGRVDNHDEIDERLSEWTRDRNAGEVVELLWGAGVPTALVQQPHRQTELPPLVSRGFFQSLDHPVIGTNRYSTVAFKMECLPDELHTSCAPLLGEHTVELLLEVGLGAAELETLESQGVISGRLGATR